MRVVACLLAVVLALASSTAAALSQDEVADRLRTAYGVEVLRVQPVEVDGRAAYAVTAMMPATAGNAAFQTEVVIVDAETGALIPQFRHGTTGYRMPGSATWRANRQAPDQLRGGFVWR